MSRLGREFRLEFPAVACRISERSPASTPFSVRAPSEMPDTGPPWRVLLVEDNEDNRLIYCTMLQRFGFDVRECMDGQTGVEVAHAWCPHVILMDLALPIMDGLTATRLLKSSASTEHIVIIALTAHAMQEDRAEALAAGCDGYISKPADPYGVIAEVERQLNIPPSTPNRRGSI